MNPIQNFFKWIDDLYSKNEQEQIAKLQDEKASLEYQLFNANTKIREQETTIDDWSEVIDRLQDELKQYEPSEESKYWNTKYPAANIEYSGRTFGTSKDYIPIDVRLLITPQDYHIHDILKQNKLYLKDNNDDIDKTIIKIYKYIKNTYYKYVYDQDNYGITEYWEFPFEILERKKKYGNAGFDCDSWANFMASFYIASGIPNWKVRVVIGGCQLGGHSTVYVHSDETNKYHHLNSTYGNNWNTYTKISQYPTTDDAETTDKLGIKNVWFSFNNDYAWHKFSSEAKQEFKKQEQPYKID